MYIAVRRRAAKLGRLAVAVLLLVAFLSNSLVFAQAANGDAAYSFAISGTEFSVTPSAAPYAKSQTEGAVEIATADGAVIWADLGGAGTGSLTENLLSGLEGVDYTISGNTLTIAGYAITVRDNSAGGTPVADGATTTYDFRDGSVVSKLYDSSHRITNGAQVTSSDKLLTLTGNSGSLRWHGLSHGITFANGDIISIKVAGDATIFLSLCAYTSDDGSFAVTSEDSGTIQPSSFSAKGVSDNDTATETIEYTGPATTLTFTYTGSGSGYLHSVSVCNEAEQTQVTEQTEMPTASSNLTATPTGQRLTLSQSGGSLNTSGSSTPENVGYYGFPATEDLNSLEADVTLTQCGNTSENGVFLGAFDSANAVVSVAGIRNSTNLRCVYSHDDGFLGAGGINATITEGQTVHIAVQKTNDDLKVTMTADTGEQYTASIPYTNSASCQLGFVAANATATVTNMVYKNAAGETLYDQNDCYAPIGQAPVVTYVDAVAAGTREAIQISWRISTAASGDGYFLVEARHDGGDWTEIARTTETSYTYPISEGGTYQFRVSGGLGMNGQGTAAVESAPVDVVRALTTPALTAQAGADAVTLTWDAVPEATSYDVYRSYDDTAVQRIATVNAPDTGYTDTAVTAEVPYYYYVIARSADNWSNPSATVWAMPSSGHTGTYLPTAEGAQFTLTEGLAPTVHQAALTVAGTVDRAGVVRAYLGDTALGDQTVSAGGSFSYDLTLAEGSNTLTLILTDADGNWSRAVYRYYYLPAGSIDMIVDANYTGTNGTPDADGIPTYQTVQAAVDAVPADNAAETVILVRAGDYHERLVVASPNITLIGEGDNTLIHCYPADLYENPDPTKPGYEAGGDMTMRCATYIQSTATNFHAENLKFANDYVYDSVDSSNQSADALRCDADGASFVNVTISGVQDTLYLGAGKQTFTNCRIEGLIDFIYSGDEAQVLFSDCEIVFVYEPTHAESGIVCAPRTAAEADCGLVFYRCAVTAEDGCAGDAFRLARPWGPDAAVYWIDCYMSGILNTAEPYQDMSGNSYQAARFYECGSYGPGYTVNENRRQISPDAAADLLALFGATDTAPLAGAPYNPDTPDTPDTPSGGGSSGGSTGGGSSAGGSSGTAGTDVTTGNAAQGGQTVTQTTAKPSAAVSGSTASAAVSAETAEAILAQAQEHDSTAVVIQPAITGSVTGTAVSIPAETVAALGENTDASLTFDTPVASVTIPNSGLAELAGSGGTVTVTAQAEDDTVTITLAAGGQTVQTVSAGITVSVPAADASSGTVAMLVQADGTTDVIRKSVAVDGTMYFPLDGSATIRIADNSKTFDDVSAADWYSGAVAFASSHELFSGMTETTFAPDTGMTRGMLAQVLYNLEGSPDADADTGFADVAADAWYAEAVSWAADAGIVSGMTETAFAPTASITREQLAVMLYRYAASQGCDMSTSDASLSGYSDTAAIHAYALTAMQWASENGLVTGMTDTTLAPQGNATRAQVATILMRLCAWMAA